MRPALPQALLLALCLGGCLSPVGAGRGEGDDKGIFGSDDRREAFDPEVDPTLAEAARSTVVLVHPSKIAPAEDGMVRLRGPRFADAVRHHMGAPMCEGEPMRDEPMVGRCSGFLVAPDVVATAGHCMQSLAQCRNTRFVFGFAREKPEDDPLNVRASDVYACKGILDFALMANVGPDHALVLLDRRVPDHPPLPLRTEGDIGYGEGVAAIGHPHGLPRRLSINATTTGRWFDRVLHSDVDIVAANSGSALLNALTYEVEGIVFHGVGTLGLSVTQDTFDLSELGELPEDTPEPCVTWTSLLSVPYLISSRAAPAATFVEPVKAALHPERVLEVVTDDTPRDIPDADGALVGLLPVPVPLTKGGELVSGFIEGTVSHPSPRELVVMVVLDNRVVATVRPTDDLGDDSWRFRGAIEGPGALDGGVHIEVLDVLGGGAGTLLGYDLTLLGRPD